MSASLRIAAVVAAVFIAVPVRADRATEACPLLPPGSGLTWTYSDARNFGVCYASAAGSSATVFGVYIGTDPDFDPTRATPLTSGIVGGRKIIWYRKDSASGADSLGRQTLIAIKNGAVIHIWVNANTEAELQHRLSILEHITFMH
jgi:hypothetical protein